MAGVVEKREVVADDEEVKQREDEHDNTTLTTLLFMSAYVRPKTRKILYAHSVCSLCLCFIGFLVLHMRS